MSILRIRNKETGEWEEIPALVGPKGERGKTGPAGPQGESGAPDIVHLAGSVQTLRLTSNVAYYCTEPVTNLTLNGFDHDNPKKEAYWSISFLTGDTITVMLPDTVVWNYNAAPVFTPGSEYWLLFTPLLNGKVLGVWNEVEA